FSWALDILAINLLLFAFLLKVTGIKNSSIKYIVSNLLVKFRIFPRTLLRDFSRLCQSLAALEIND
ncbi:MAG: hypothetical protein NZL93_02985, partial [Chthoniobacterales bacterium]|nr:hypothetical protein [Chthoniobacterales bacterium]